MNCRLQRRRPARGILFVDHQPTVVFLTVCTKDRRSSLTNPVIHMLLRRVWLSATAWRVGYYVVMPDHIHLFACPSDVTNHDFDAWVCFWKSSFTRFSGLSQPVWQRASFHHRIRCHQDAESKYRYMIENPVRRGLAETAEDWPFRGIIFNDPVLW